jgi:hypothetical protein
VTSTSPCHTGTRSHSSHEVNWPSKQEPSYGLERPVVPLWFSLHRHILCMIVLRPRQYRASSRRTLWIQCRVKRGFARVCRDFVDLSSLSNELITQICRCKPTDQQNDCISSILIPVFWYRSYYRFVTIQHLILGYSDTRKKTTTKSPFHAYGPAVRASNVAAVPRAGRALGHTLVSKLGLQYRHVAFSAGSSVVLVDGSSMVVVYSLTLRLCTG